MAVANVAVAGIVLAILGCARVPDEGVPQTTIQMELLAEAVRQYDAELGSPPPGGSRAIFRALHGENPRGLPFIRSRRDERPDEFLDPWGTSYDVSLVANGVVRVRSAGPNGRLGDDDDRELQVPLNRRTPR